MAFSIVTCSFCFKNFFKDNRHINENVKLKNNFYCSRKCQYSSSNKQVELICENPDCRNKFRRAPNDISTYNFCSRPCYGTLVTVRNKLGLNKLNTNLIKRNYCQYCGNKVAKSHKYCSNQCSGKSRQISQQELINNIVKLSYKLGRTPTKRECTYSSSAHKHFGSWSNALIAAGLTPHRSLNQRMYKRRLCFAKDGHKCNSVSELLIDNWFYKNAIDHQKEIAYPKGKFTADWSLSENTFVEYFGLANDSRRYDEEIKKKQQICRDSGIKLIEIYSKHLFPKNKLEQLFQDGESFTREIS